ncbi:membrane protein [Cellvibrio zantedeschiae]|uniref:Membrane protein n=1 Tax=Cellvibrio zantedeschiae TaxID=1237077 RepID=A0ABQ3B5M9_9GAMM|nr:putative porin [Cellvibrio zantedeschiae]GGY80794.1 membrane protein [Cellvibrio zantedeschiae]
MKLKLIFGALVLATSGFSIADAYQAEVGANASRWDLDGINSSINSYQVDGKYYFNQVKTDNLPLAEAAYLGKNSNAFLSLARDYGHGFVSDSKNYSGGVEVYIPENFLYVRVEGIHERYDGSSDTSALTTVGLTPFDGLRLTTSWNSDESYHANLDAKYVTALANGQYINVEASVADTEWGTYKAIGGDYYFDRTFSVGAEISDEDLTGTSYLVRTRKFFSEQFSGDLTYADNDYGNVVALGVNFRF